LIFSSYYCLICRRGDSHPLSLVSMYNVITTIEREVILSTRVN
jgi:hypothetical protein